MANTLAGRLGRITKSRDVRAGLAGLVAIAVVTGALRAVQDEPNPTIAALLLLLAVLVTGTLSSLSISIVISITATLAFVYFLLPPYEVWSVSDPQHWQALWVFVGVAIVASRLSAVVRKRTGDTYAYKLTRRLERTINSRQTYKFFVRDWTSLTDLKACARVVSTMRFNQTLQPLEMSFPRGKHIAIIAPHPDDEMLGAGGTLIHARHAGADIRCIYLTSGNPAGEVMSETAEVARHIGYRTEFLRFPVHGIPLTDDSVSQLGAALSAEPIDALFLPVLFDDHDDHRRANQLLWHVWQAGLLPRSTELWCYQVYSPVISNVVVDISDVAEEKAAAIRMWKSQIKIRKFDHYILGLNAFNIRLLPKARYVEGFFVLPLHEYADLCAIYFKDPDAAFYNPAYKVGANAAGDIAGVASAR